MDDVGKMTACPKCGLDAKSLLHPLCTHKKCPVRDAFRMRALADEGMRQGRAISASVRIWEYEDIEGNWREARNADDACMWAEDGRRIREKLAEDVGRPVPKHGSRPMIAVEEAANRLRENLASFDAEAAFELANEGERSDLWTEIDVNVEDLRTVLSTLTGTATPGGEK
jgi:hypothetical protein